MGHFLSALLQYYLHLLWLLQDLQVNHSLQAQALSQTLLILQILLLPHLALSPPIVSLLDLLEHQPFSLVPQLTHQMQCLHQYQQLQMRYFRLEKPIQRRKEVQTA